ncbi:MAG: DUF805 domain-containing protein [Lachnospiraceae bacterium]|nr:DUF805 domain-containing protein [Lachnospiraceae bacterium]
MSFTEAIQSVFSKYADFNGRARRSEYWYFCLFNFLVNLVLSFLAQKISIFGIISGVFALAVLVPGLAVAFRRLHDIGKSGWNILFCLIPLVGSIILIIFFCKEGDMGDNMYGADPKSGSGIAEY